MPPTIVDIQAKEFSDDQPSSGSSRSCSESTNAAEELQDETAYESYITKLTRFGIFSFF